MLDWAQKWEKGGAMQNNPGVHSATGLRVRFVGGEDGALSVLELEIPRSQEVMSEVHQELSDAGVRIAGIEVQVTHDRVVERLRVTEPDGHPVSRSRHLELQTVVMGAVQRRLCDSVRPPAPTAEPMRSAG